MKLLLDEMYPVSLAEALRERDVDAVTVAEIGFAGRPDPDVLKAAIDGDRVLLTENVADFAALAAEDLLADRHHPGVLIALSSRFSRRPSGRVALVDAVLAVRDEVLADRVLFLATAG